MKRIAFFIIAFAMSLSINAQDYQKLWQEFNNNIENLLPESAEKVLNNIEKQAIKDKNDIQLLKVVLKRSEILNMTAEKPEDTIPGLCKSYLPKLSEASQVILNVEIAKSRFKIDDILDYQDNDFIKTVPMENYAELFENANDQRAYDIALEPTLYDYVMHCIINHYSLYQTKNYYEKLLAFDLKNNYTKAYYNNRINQLGYINGKNYDDFSKLADECPDNELVAKIKCIQIDYQMSHNEYVRAKKLCEDIMTLVDKTHPLYQQCVDVIKNLSQKTIEAQLNNVYVPNQAIPVGLTYRNTTNPSYKIYKFTTDEFLKLSHFHNDEELLTQVLSKEPIAENTLEIPAETDYRKHSSLIALPALKCGVYYVVFSNNDSFKNYNDLIIIPFQVSNLAFFNLEAEDNLNFYVVNRETGEPLSNVVAHFTEQSYSYDTKFWDRKAIADVVSDINGCLVAPKTKKNAYYVDLYYLNDTLLSSELLNYYKRNNADNLTIESRIFTDRAIYRPGQTVYFNCLVYRGNSKQKEVFQDYETTVKFFDANNQLIDSLNVTTNEYGAANGSFTIPTDRLNGYFKIREQYGSELIKVEEYKRPTFEITFEAPADEYKIGDSISVSGKVAALSGFGLDDVKYAYTVIRKTAFPYRYWYWKPPYHVEDETISTGESVTLNDGSFIIDFQLQPSEDYEVINMPKYTYEIIVEATNKQGETQKGTFSISATYNKYDISLNSQKQAIDIKEFKDLSVTVTNINGKPASTKVECKVFKINDIDRYAKDLGDFDRQLLSDQLLKAYFPHFDYYSKENISKDIVYQDVIDVNGKEKLFLDNLKLSPAKYIVELHSVDDTLSKFSEQYVVYDIKSKKMPYKSIYWTNIDKTSAQPGETINFQVGSSEKNVSVLIIVKRENTIVKSQRITLNNSVYKLSYKVKEEDRGRLDFQVAIVRYNTEMRRVEYVDIPFNNLDLDIVLHTERDKTLPGAEETMSVTIKDYKGKPIEVPLMATMYDAALDNFNILHWNINNKPLVRAGSFIMTDRSFQTKTRYQYYHVARLNFKENQMFSQYNLISDIYGRKTYGSSNIYYCMDNAVIESAVFKRGSSDDIINTDYGEAKPQDNPPAKIRKDFNETAFFYPDLKTDENGDCTFTFTMPDVLTRWNLKLLSYSKTLSVGNLEKTIVTQQPLMIMADMPRFVYDEDTLWIAANVINLSEEALAPTAKLEIFDENDNSIDLILSGSNINMESIPAGCSQNVRWKVAMQKDINPLTFRFSAITDGFSDAEQHLLPVLSTDIFMTQTYSLMVNANTSKVFVYGANNENERNYVFKLDVKANPILYAVQSLPYIAEGDEKYVLTAFNRYFVNMMAQEIIRNNPNIKELLEENANDTLSELQKYEEVKAILLKETPWVLEAKSEAQQRANVSKLFDNETVDKNIASALSILEQKQTVNGGWPWMDGMPESEYITQYILSGLGRLGENTEMTEKAFHFLENEVITRYKKLDTQKKKDNAVCDFMTMKDFFAMSYFDYKTNKDFDEAKAFYIKKLYKDWRRFSIEEQAYIALILNRNNHNEVAKLVIKSLRERALKNELGMYWRYTSVETEARILEAFNEIDPQTEEIDNMRLWILTQKRTNMWENDRATVEAIFALMNRGTVWNENLVDASMTTDDDGTIHVYVHNNTNHVIWGGVFRQYFVPIDKVQKHNDAMKIKREIIMSENVKVGDKVTVEITFESSQDMEFVYLKDLRGACFEPTEQLSRYHWNNELWYYQSTTDVSMEYFFEYLPKGKHTVSYEMYVTKDGSFSAGYSHIQCQYAPEFSAYSNGERIIVE